MLFGLPHSQKSIFSSRVSQVGYVYRTIMRSTHWLTQELLITAELILRILLRIFSLSFCIISNNITSKLGVIFLQRKKKETERVAWFLPMHLGVQLLNFSCLLSPCGQVVCHFRWWKVIRDSGGGFSTDLAFARVAPAGFCMRAARRTSTRDRIILYLRWSPPRKLSCSVRVLVSRRCGGHAGGKMRGFVKA